MKLGSIVYEDGALIVPITRIRLRADCIEFTGYIANPEPRVYNFGGWARIHGEDGSIIMERVQLAKTTVDNRTMTSGPITVEQPVMLTQPTGHGERHRRPFTSSRND